MIDPDRQFAAIHLPAAVRDDVETLWQFDALLGNAVLGQSQPLLAAIRLQWWREALDGAEPPRDPVLIALLSLLAERPELRPLVHAMIDGWGAMTAGEVAPEVALGAMASGRAAMFDASAFIISGKHGEAVHAAGRGWALADFARHCPDATLATLAWQASAEAFAGAAIGRLPRALRVLARLAAGDARAAATQPRTAWRLWRAAR